MQTMDMTFGDLVYRLVYQRDPPWNNDASAHYVNRVLRRPERLIEWVRAFNPLEIHFCRCGHLREIGWHSGYVYRILYPKPPFTVGLCSACGALSRIEEGLQQYAKQCAANMELEKFRMSPPAQVSQKVVIEVDLGPWEGIDQLTRLWRSDAGASTPVAGNKFAAQVWPPVEWRPGGWHWQVCAWKTDLQVEGQAKTIELAKEAADEALGCMIAWMTSGGAEKHYEGIEVV
jgi:hypothetical protein